jgi:eukaryotic-like serine/threonine-protein kinase
MREEDRDLWRAADEALERLLDFPPAERRDALVAMALPAPLADRVAGLLEAAGRSFGPLEGTWRDHVIAEVEPSPDPLLGRVLGVYRLVERLGRGGMSQVYRAERCDGRFEQQVAVKLLSWHLLGSEGEARFRREQRILAALRHPHIATLFDGGLCGDGTPYLVMELVEGEQIDLYCQRRGLDAAARIDLVRQVCAAVSYAHARLVVHRDIKPANVLVDHHGQTRLLDFGIAKLVTGDEEELTRADELALTPSYASPEQLRGETVTTATDVYGLGLLLHQLLTGRAPFGHLQGRRDPGSIPPPPSRARMGVDPVTPADRRHRRRLRGDLDRIVMMALRPEPERRYPTVGELERDLERWRRQLPVAATPDTLAYRLRKLAARRAGAVVASALVLAVGAAGLAGTVWQAR